MKKLFTAILLIAVIAGTVSAQEIKLSGQFRERSEFDTKSFKIGQSSDVYHWLRTRLRADAAINEQVNVVFEVQDARQYGVPASTMNTGSPAFDLRQGFLEVKNLCDMPVTVKLGRQVLSYGDERLLGAIDWNNQGQSFDAALARIGSVEFSVDIFGAAIARNSNAIQYTRDHFLAGAWAKWIPKEVRLTFQGFALHDNPAFEYDANRREQRTTLGIYGGGHFEGFDFEIDGAYQTGIIEQNMLHGEWKLSANLIGLRIGYTLKELANLRIGIGYDRLSGTDPKSTDSTFGAFNTLYATNHKYYGFMDIFTDIPRQTMQMGLQDIIVQLSCEPVTGFRLAADGHLFSTTIDPADIDPIITAKKNIGMELDLTGSVKVAKVVNVTLGFSLFDRDKDALLFSTSSRKTTNWAYVMTMVNL
jgi:hypothetical protein